MKYKGYTITEHSHHYIHDELGRCKCTCPTVEDAMGWVDWLIAEKHADENLEQIDEEINAIPNCDYADAQSPDCSDDVQSPDCHC